MSFEVREGTLFAGKYKIVRRIAAGAMGAVYEVVHLETMRRRALKIMHAHVAAMPELRERFTLEAQAAARIDSELIVDVFDAGVDPETETPFLVMELLRGEELGRRLKRLGRFTPDDAMVYLHQAALALDKTHRAGIVHRDLKPSNLFLTEPEQGAPRVKVLDFGVAKLVAEGTAGGTAAVGTPLYMAPEQLRGGPITGAADRYALAMIAFTFLVGDAYWSVEMAGGGGPLGFALAAVHGPVEPASARAAMLGVSLPPAFDAWFARAAAADPAQRFASASEAVRALGEALGTAVPVSAPRSVDPLVAPASEGATRPGEGSSGAAPDGSTQTLTGSAGGAPGAVTRPSGDVTATHATPTSPEGEGIAASQAPARHANVPASPPRPARRLRRVIAIAALGVGALAGAFFFGWRARPRAPGDVATVAPPKGCTASRACTAANGGRPSICRHDDGVCVALEAEGCHVLAGPGDVEDDATIWVGAMFPETGPDATVYGLASMQVVDLARRDFAEVASGLPPARPGGPRRPLAVVACDDAASPARAAAHLVDDLHVPAVLGFARSKEVIDLADTLFLPKGVLALASNTASMLRSIPHPAGQPRLVWRTTTSADMKIPAVAALLSEVLEPALRRAQVLPGPRAPIRVAVALMNNASGLSYSDLCVSQLHYNGKTVAENGDAFRIVGFADATDDEERRRVEERAGEELAAFRPHVVIEAGTFGAAGIAALERSWPAGERFRPRYVLAELTTPEILKLVRARPDLRTRLFGVDASTSAPSVKLALHENEALGTHEIPQTVHGAPYDAFYTLAYAIAASGDAAPTGPSLARALARLVPPGEPIEVGPAGIYPALHALASGRSIDLEGTTTTLDFDPETGDASADFTVYCIGAAGPVDARSVVDSGLVFRARAGKLEGTLGCR
jgi:Protein kinase domain